MFKPIDKWSEDIKYYSAHFGYINLFPLFFGYQSNSILDNILKKIRNKDELWTEWGLRSLSKDDYYYGFY